MPTFDPWNDAQTLSRHLAKGGAELLTVIGAEGWCQKCQRLRPAFDVLCQQTQPPHVAWMWLDLEDHQELIGGFVPPNLPLLLRWRDGICVQAAVIVDIAPDATPAERVVLHPLVIEGSRIRDPHERDLLELPSLWTEFSSTSWATGS